MRILIEEAVSSLPGTSAPLMSLVGSNDDHLIVGIIPTILIEAVALAPWGWFWTERRGHGPRDLPTD